MDLSLKGLRGAGAEYGVGKQNEQSVTVWKKKIREKKKRKKSVKKKKRMIHPHVSLEEKEETGFSPACGSGSALA